MTFRHGIFTLGIALIAAVLITVVTSTLQASTAVEIASLSDLSTFGNKVALGDFTDAVKREHI